MLAEINLLKAQDMEFQYTNIHDCPNYGKEECNHITAKRKILEEIKSVQRSPTLIKQGSFKNPINAFRRSTPYSEIIGIELLHKAASYYFRTIQVT